MKIFLLSKLLRTSKTNETINILSKNPIFSKLNTLELKILSKLVHLRHYSAGEYIFKQNQMAMGMYIVAKGEVQILNEDIYIDPKTEKEQIKSKKLSTLKEGEFLGELTIVNENAFRKFSARAQVPSILIGLFRADLLELMETRPLMATKILYSLSSLLAEQIERMVK